MKSSVAAAGPPREAVEVVRDEVREVQRYRLGAAAFVRFQMYGGADARAFGRSDCQRHNRVRADALRVRDRAARPARPREHRGVDAGVAQLRKVRVEELRVRRAVGPRRGVERRVQPRRRFVRVVLEVLVLGANLFGPVREDRVVPMQPLAVRRRRAVPQVVKGVSLLLDDALRACCRCSDHED